MLSDEEYASLPEVPELAFVELVKVLNLRLEGIRPSERNDVAHEYVQVILAFSDENELALGVDRSYPRGTKEFNDWFVEFKNEVIYTQNRFRFRNRSGVPDGAATVSLNDEFRGQIHKLLNRIRKVVAQLKIGETKKDAILNRIGALAVEVDKDRTRLDAFGRVFSPCT